MYSWENETPVGFKTSFELCHSNKQVLVFLYIMSTESIIHLHVVGEKSLTYGIVYVQAIWGGGDAR